MLTLLGNIAVWLVLWIAVWKVFYGFLAGRGINYVDRFATTAAYFGALSALIIVLFRRIFARTVGDFTLVPFIVLAGAFVLHLLLYRIGRRHLARPDRLIESNPREFFLLFDYRYLASKAFELLFQQVMIVLLVLFIHEQFPRTLPVIVIYAAVFALGHLPLFGLFGEQERFFAVLYAFAALASAIVFPLVILKVPYGFVYTYTVHSLWYTFLALWFWARHTAKGSRA